MIDLTNPNWELKLEDIKFNYANHVNDEDDIQFLLDLIEELKDKLEDVENCTK